MTVTTRPPGPAKHLGAAPQVAAYADGPLGGGLDAGGELLVGERKADQAAGAGVHGGGEEPGPDVGGDQHHAHRGEAQGDFADQLQGGDGPDPLVYEDHLGQFVEGVRGELAQGVEEGGGIGDGSGGLGVRELAEQRHDGAGGVRVMRPRGGFGWSSGPHLSPSRVYVRSLGPGVESVPGATRARRTCSAKDSAYATRWVSLVFRAKVIGTASAGPFLSPSLSRG